MKIKYSLLMMSFVACLSFFVTSCSDDDEPSVTPTDTGVVTDRDGNEYKWVRIGNLDWMTENLHCDAPFYEDQDNEKWDSYDGLHLQGGYEANKGYYETFGNYYTWQEAVDNAPEGWRLPSDEDFKALEHELGMKSSDLDKEGWRSGASHLMTQRNEGTMLDFRCGGEICYYSWQTAIYHPYDYGYYWTSTREDVNGEPASYARMITPGKNAVNRLKILHEKHFLNVRYVRDAK